MTNPDTATKCDGLRMGLNNLSFKVQQEMHQQTDWQTDCDYKYTLIYTYWTCDVEDTMQAYTDIYLLNA